MEIVDFIRNKFITLQGTKFIKFSTISMMYVQCNVLNTPRSAWANMLFNKLLGT